MTPRQTRATMSARILVVDDFEPWHDFTAKMLRKEPHLEVVGNVSDGSAAVQQAQRLKPDLILLDIGLPVLNGIEAAIRIRKSSPSSKILFVSENCSEDIVEKALSTGAAGYVIKSNAASELLPAIRAVLEGRRFVSAIVGRMRFPSSEICAPDANHHGDTEVGMSSMPAGTIPRHEVVFYSDDRTLLDHLTHFVGASLKGGNAAIVVATESHRDGLLPRLQAYGLDIGVAIEQGRWVTLDAADALAEFIRNRMPDPVVFMKVFNQLILNAAKATQLKQPRVAIYGECVHLLWAQGNPAAAIQLERLGNKLTLLHDVDILCGYRLGSVQGGMDSATFNQLCEQHSAVHWH